MDTRDTTRDGLQALCLQLARDFPFAARRAFHGRSGRRRARLTGDCPLLQKLPGEESQQDGLPRFQQDNRSLEYKTSGWKLEPDGKRLDQHPRAQ
jgi:putative transposase